MKQIFKAVAEDFKVKTSLTPLFLNTFTVITNAKLEQKKQTFFQLTKVVDIPSPGRIIYFLVNSQKLTLNQDILSVVKGYTIPITNMDQELKGDVEGRENKKNSTCPTQLVQPAQPIPCGEKLEAIDL